MILKSPPHPPPPPSALARVQPCPLPAEALLSRYAGNGAYLDGYRAEVTGRVDLARFVETFYTGALFRLERRLLQTFAGFPSTDDDVRQLANGQRRRFSAWRVEDRTVQQLLMIDEGGRTRSWLMVKTAEAGDGATGDRTRLYFGSAVLPVIDQVSGERRLGAGFRSLLGFHRLYSRLLLSSAASRLG